jgi:hypothetical protein
MMEKGQRNDPWRGRLPRAHVTVHMQAMTQHVGSHHNTGTTASRCLCATTRDRQCARHVSKTRYVPLSQHSPDPHSSSLQDSDVRESLDVLNRMPTVTKAVYATIGSVPIHRLSLGSRLWGALGLQIVRLQWSDSLDC